MGKDGNSKRTKGLAILLGLALLTSLLTGLAPQAQEPQRVPLDPDDVNAPTEIGEAATEWIAYFTQCPANDIACEEPQCMGFYDEMDDAGWGGYDSFHWGNCSAWAEDFKRSASGGTENFWIDDVDIALFCDHGTSTYDTFWGKTLSALHFGCQDPDGDCNVSPGEAYLSYGDNDLEWLAFKACSVLSDGGPAPYYNRGYWAATMNELHLLLGFKNSSYCDSDFGEKWAEYMLGWKFLWFWLRPPYKVTQAWFEAVDDTQPAGVCARVLAEESYFYNDYLWGKGTVYDDYQDGDYTYWDHCVSTSPPKQVDGIDQIQTLPVYTVVDRQVDEGYIMQRVAPAFPELGGAEIYSNTDYFFMVSSPMVEASAVATYTLQVDKTTGSYKFRNATELWATPPMTVTLPSENEAISRAEGFFRELGWTLPGREYRNGGHRYMVEQQIGTMEAPADASPLDEVTETVTPTNVSLSYGRMLDVAVGTASGMRMVPLSVVGPGARTVLYLGDGGEMLGIQGGSRDVVATKAQVPIMDPDTAWGLYLENPAIALAPLPWAYDQIVRTGQTLGYYEHEYTQQQSELIPAYIFTADLLGAEGNLLETGVQVYVPAATEYLPPVPSIDAPPPDSEVSIGEMVTFKGSAEFGKEPYTFDWYSSHDGLLGSGQTLDAILTGAVEKGSLVSHTITLQVTDANGQKGAASENVYVRTAVYLPIVLKGH
jgi:hypothetical protein